LRRRWRRLVSVLMLGWSGTRLVAVLMLGRLRAIVLRLLILVLRLLRRSTICGLLRRELGIGVVSR